MPNPPPVPPSPWIVTRAPRRPNTLTPVACEISADAPIEAVGAISARVRYIENRLMKRAALRHPRR